MLKSKHGLHIYRGLKAALAGAVVDNAGPVPELVSLISAEASVLEAPLPSKNKITDTNVSRLVQSENRVTHDTKATIFYP